MMLQAAEAKICPDELLLAGEDWVGYSQSPLPGEPGVPQSEPKCDCEEGTDAGLVLGILNTGKLYITIVFPIYNGRKRKNRQLIGQKVTRKWAQVKGLSYKSDYLEYNIQTGRINQIVMVNHNIKVR